MGRGVVNRRELASVLGVTIATITRWQEDGMPAAVKGGPGKSALYDVEVCRTWRAARPDPTKPGGISLQEERGKLARVQTQRQELELKRRQGELLDADDVSRTWSNIVAAVRSKLLAIPRAAADRAFQEATSVGPGGVERVLREAVFDALRELSSWEPPATAAPSLAVPEAVSA